MAGAAIIGNITTRDLPIHQITSTPSSMKFILLAIFHSFIGVSISQAQVLITAFNTPYTEDFDAFNGNEETLPTNFVFTPAAVGMTYNGFYTRSEPYGNLSRVAALRDTPESSDIAFGMKPATSGVSTLDWSFRNETGAAVTTFVVSWDFEQYSESGRATRLTFAYGVNGGKFGNQGIAGEYESVASHRPPFVPPGGMNLDAVRVEQMSVVINLDNALLPGEEITFRWNFITGSQLGDSNNNAYIGIDNLSVAAIPEPTGVAFLLLGLPLLAGGLRRVRRRN